jgi:iron-sulfur cluster assembly accessory protein
MNYFIINSGIIGADKEDEIMISSNAMDRIKFLKNKKNLQDSFIRIGVLGSACEGLRFSLGFDKELTIYDRKFYIEDELIVIDIKSIFYLLGVKLEYDLNGNKTFEFVMPFNMRAMDCSI